MSDAVRRPTPIATTKNPMSKIRRSRLRWQLLPEESSLKSESQEAGRIPENGRVHTRVRKLGYSRRSSERNPNEPMKKKGLADEKKLRTEA